jgi:pimeloyl-ACP methyl ester carboxylesterase
MRVWEAGEGPVILAVHGLGGSGRYWQGLASAAGDRFRVVAPDLGGFGSSDKPHLRYDRPFQLANLEAVMEDLGPVAPPFVVGHSLGGILGALRAATPPGAAGLVLAGTPYPSVPDGFDGRRAQRETPVGRRAVAAAARAVWPFVALPIGAVRGYPASIVLDFGRPTLESRSQTLASLLWDPALAPELARAAPALAAVPTLLINATDDTRVPMAAQDAWAERLPGAARAVVGHGGHQFLLRSDFAPLVAWLDARSAAA